jgi:hypothetical protein
MDSSFEESLIDVWRQVLVENIGVVVLGAERYPVRLSLDLIFNRFTMQLNQHSMTRNYFSGHA